MIFSLNRRLSGGTKLALELVNKLGKLALHIYDTRKERKTNSFRLEIHALTDFLSSNKIEILNVAGLSGIEGARGLRLDPDNVEVSESGSGSRETAGRVGVE